MWRFGLVSREWVPMVVGEVGVCRVIAGTTTYPSMGTVKVSAEGNNARTFCLSRRLV